MNRTEAIIILEGFKDNPLFNSTHAQALDMAIVSLKTDEAYQLEYENRDFVEIPEGMTNGEVIQAVFDVMVLTIKDGKVWVERIFFPFDEVWWNAPYKAESEE